MVNGRRCIALMASICLIAISTPMTAQIDSTRKDSTRLTKADTLAIQQRSAIASARIDALAASVATLQQQLAQANKETTTPSTKAEQRRIVKIRLYPAVLGKCSDFLYTMVIGTASTFTGSGISTQEINLQDATSPWRSSYLRNTVDKAKPYTDGLGALAIGIGVATAGNQNAGTSKSLGIAGALTLVAGSLLKALAGSNEDKVMHAVSTQLDTLQVQVDQIYLSKEANNEIEIRRTLANRYYKNAGQLLDTLKALKDTLVALQTQAQELPTADPLSKIQADSADAFNARVTGYIDHLFAVVSSYEGVVSFVDEYSNNLSQSYRRYSEQFTTLKIPLLKAKAEVDAFQSNFVRNIRGPWLDALPSYRVALSDLRTELKK